MTAEEHQTMKEYLLRSDSESLWNGVVRNFTYANVATLIFWTGSFLVDPEKAVSILFWLKVLMIALIISFSGWLADRLWFFLLSDKFEKPFSLTAYASRVPFFFFLSGIFLTIPLFLSKLIGIEEVMPYFLIGGTAQCGIQIPLQWVLFNRLRKLSLTNL
jgi:hypothetical protein